MGKMIMEMINSTRPCIATVMMKIERTNEELDKMYEESGMKISRASFYGNYRYYHERREVPAKWHMFGQETEEDSNGNIQYPIAIVELEDGTVKTVCAEDVKFIKEENK